MRRTSSILEGRVVDRAKKPVPGAWVRCAGTVEDLFAQTRWVKADRKGQFVLRSPRTRTAVFVASTPPQRGVSQAFTSREVRLPVTRPVTLTIDLGVVVSGTVRAAATGKPVAGATIEASVTSPPYMGPVSAADLVTTTSDRAGRFSLRQLGDGEVEVSVWAARYGAQTVVLEGAARDEVVRLEPRRKSTGQVVDEKGKPISRVSLVSRGRDPIEVRKGRFALELDDTEQVVFQAPGRPAVIQTLSPGAKDQRVVLSRGRSVAVTVVDARGQPVSGVEVSEALDTEWWPLGVRSASRSVKTNELGVATLTRVCDGDVKLHLLGAGGARKWATCASSQRTLQVSFGAGAGLRGVVIDELGTRIAGLRVVAAPLTEGLSYKSARTDEAGSFTFEVLAAGEYRIRTDSDSVIPLVPQDVRIVDGEEVTLRLTTRFPYLPGLHGSLR